jgi:hypothetical protein
MLQKIFVFVVIISISQQVQAAIFTVTNTSTSGAGSLTQAMLSANATSARDTINFNIPGVGPHTIGFSSSIPYFPYPVFLDGYSQPGATPANLTTPAVIKIIIDGLNSAGYGFQLDGACEIRGFSIVRFTNSGIMAWNDLGTNQISGNYIGIYPDGITKGPNGFYGISTLGWNPLYTHIIGGTSPADRNIISGNGTPGGMGIGITVGYNGCIIQGNYIGTDHTGTIAIGNLLSGIDNGNVKNTQILDNIISGNNGNGIEIDGQPDQVNNPYGLVIKRNRIGIGKNGETIANTGNGISMVWAHDITVGGSIADGNIIAYNGHTGVTIMSSWDTGMDDTYAILVQGNSIFSNGNLGIDLIYGGDPTYPSPNDPGDTDIGPNGRQNFPVIQSVYYSGANLIVEGNLNSTPSRSFHVEIFLNPASVPGAFDNLYGYGEGHTLIHTMTLTTDINGDAPFLLSIPKGSSVAGDYISSTATDLTTNNTSEFSFSREIIILDFGDAPDPSYPTLLANNGARHKIVAGYYMGSSLPDSEADGLPSADAGFSGSSGDDGSDTDDEDGVVLPVLFSPPSTYTIQVIVDGAGGYLNAWIDWNRNGSWNDAADQIAFNVNDGSASDADHTVNGIIELQVQVPCGPAVVEGVSFARFRWSSQSGLNYIGYASNGEVEDYQVALGTPVPSPVADAGADRTICGGGFTQLGRLPVPGETYQWSPSSDINATHLANPVFSSMIGDYYGYTVVVTNQYGCQDDDDILITVNDPVQYTHTQSDPTCFGAGNGTITITATGGNPPYSYSLDNGLTYPYSGPSPYLISNLSPGNYKIRVKDSDGCETIPCL